MISGVLRNVQGTKMDFRVPTQLRSTFHETKRVGFDNSFCVNAMPPDSLLYVGRIEHPPTGRVLEIHSDQPSVHFYTGRYLPPRNEERCSRIKKAKSRGASQDVKKRNSTKRQSAESENSTNITEPNESVRKSLRESTIEPGSDDLYGKNESFYFENDGMWLAPQWFPNAPNVKNFENCILMPGDTYKYYTIYHFFSIKKTKKQLEKERLDAEAIAAALEALAEITQRAIDAVDKIQSEITGSLLQVI